MAIVRRAADIFVGPDTTWLQEEGGPRRMARRFFINTARTATTFTLTTPFLGWYDELFSGWDWDDNRWFRQTYVTLRKAVDSIMNPFNSAPSLLARRGAYDNKEIEGNLCTSLLWGRDPYCYSWSQGGHMQAMGPVERFLRGALGDSNNAGWLLRDRDLGFRRADWAWASFMNTYSNSYAREAGQVAGPVARNLAIGAAIASNPAGALIQRNRAYANLFTIQQLLTVPANVFGGLIHELAPIVRCLYFGGRNRDYHRRASCVHAFPAAYRVARRSNPLGWVWNRALERTRAGGTETWMLEDTD